MIKLIILSFSCLSSLGVVLFLLIVPNFITRVARFWLVVINATIALWGFLYFLLLFGFLEKIQDPFNSLLVSSFFMFPIVLSFSFLCLIEQYRKQKKDTLYWIYPLFIGALAIVAWPNFIITDIRMAENFEIITERTTYGTLIFNIVLFSLYLFFLYRAQKRIREEPDLVVKKQLSIMVYSFYIGLVFSFWATVVLPAYFDNPDYRFLGSTFFMCFSWSAFYAVSQYRFINSTLASFHRRVTLICSFLAFVFPALLVWYIFPEIREIFWELMIFSSGISIVLSKYGRDVFTSHPMARFLGGSDEEKIELAKKEIYQKISDCSSSGETEALLSTTVERYLSSSFAKIELESQKVKNDPLCTFLQEKKVWIRKEEFYRNSQQALFKTKIEGDVVIPFKLSDGDVFGFLCVGEKRNKDLFTKDEIKGLIEISYILSLKLIELQYQQALIIAVEEKTQELGKANQRLEQRDKEKDEFLSITAHEIRTPLNVIKGYAEIFSDNKFGPLSPEYQDCGEQVLESANSLQLFVSNILEMARLEKGKNQLLLSNFDLREELHRIEEHFSLISQQKEVKLNVEISAKISSSIISDKEKWIVILRNLISNAFKFTQKGEINIKIKVEKSFFIIQVQDTGQGISATKKEQIFKNFSQINRSREGHRKGFGLGLFIVRKFSEMLRGSVSVESKEGVGSTFFVKIYKYIDDDL